MLPLVTFNRSASNLSEGNFSPGSKFFLLISVLISDIINISLSSKALISLLSTISFLRNNLVNQI
jgi:hypothetical protein